MRGKLYPLFIAKHDKADQIHVHVYLAAMYLVAICRLLCSEEYLSKNCAVLRKFTSVWHFGIIMQGFSFFQAVSVPNLTNYGYLL